MIIGLTIVGRKWSQVRLFESRRRVPYVFIRYELLIPSNWLRRWFGAKVSRSTESWCVLTNDCARPGAAKGLSSYRGFDLVKLFICASRKRPPISLD